MGSTLKQKIDAQPKKRRKAIKARTRELIAEQKEYGVRLKSTENKKWIWHRNREGEINRFTKEGAENRAGMWGESKDVKVMKITARSK